MIRLIIFTFLLLLYGLVHLNVIGHLLHLWWSVDTYNYGLVIPIVSIWLIMQRWRATPIETGRSLAHSAFGLTLLASALVMALIGVSAGARLIEHIAFFAGIFAIFVLVFGLHAAFYHRFAFFFLFLAIPFGEDFIPVLQVVTADATIFILKFLNIPISTEGVLIYTPFGNFEVARACAGIRFFITSFVVGILLSHLLFEKWWRKLMMVLVASIVPIFANIIRVVSIILIARSSDISFAKNVDHIIYGWVFLGLVLILIMAFGYRMADKVKNAHSPYRRTGLAHSFRFSTASAVIFTLMIAGKAYAGHVLTSEKITFYPEPSLTILPCENCLERVITDHTRLLLNGHLNEQFSSSNVAKQKMRFFNQLIEINRVLVDTKSPTDTRLLDMFRDPLSGSWTIVPGVGRKIITKNGRIWISRALIKQGKKRLLLISAVRGDTVFTSVSEMKINLALARLLGEKRPVDLALATMSSVGDWRTAEERLVSILDQRIDFSD